MVEVIVDINPEELGLTPIQVKIIYNEDGDILSVDWRLSVFESLDTIHEDYNSDDDPEFIPGIDTDTDDSLEYDSDASCNTI